MKVALHSVGYSGTWGSPVALSLENFIKKTADLGYDGVEILGKRPHASPLDLDQKALKNIAELADSLGLEVACLAGYHDWAVGADHPDMAGRQKELLYLREEIKMAVNLGAPVVRTYSGYLHPEATYEQQWRWCVEGLKEGAKMAEDYGVYLGLQNHSPIAAYFHDCLAMIEEVGSDHLKLVLDAPLMAERGEDLAACVKRAGNLIIHSHAADFVRVAGNQPGGFFTILRVRVMPMGTGEIDYPTFIKALKGVGYDGYISYEMCSSYIEGGTHEGNLDRLARIALQYLKDQIRKA